MNYYYTESYGGQWKKWPAYCPIPTFDDLEGRMIHGTGRHDWHVTVNCPTRSKALRVHSFCKPSGKVWDATLAKFDKMNGTDSNKRTVDPKTFMEFL